MERATISELKNHFSAYLKKVQAGEPVLVLDRDQPVARLERISPSEEPEGALARLEREGLIRRATQAVPLDLLKSAAPKSKQSVLKALLEEREEER